MPAALDFQEGLGWERIRARIAELAAYARQRIALELATPCEPGLHGALTAFRVPPGYDPAALRKRLWEQYRIEAPVIERPDRILLRVSTHFYTTEEEIDRLHGALQEFLT